MLRMSRTKTMIQRAKKRRLKMIGARKPGACSRRDSARAGFDDGRNAVGVQKRIIVLHGVRILTKSRDRFRRRRTLIQDHPHDQVG